jgi:steroid delta-isomerase-like uncharacterized protein
VAPATQTAEETERIVRDYFARITARDPDGMMKFWQPGKGARIHGIADLVAPDSYRAWFANLFAAFPDLNLVVEEVVADESRAAVRWRATGTFNGTAQFEGFEPTGAKVDIQGLDLLTIEDGKLTDNQAYTNGMELARQIGVMPPQGSGAEKAMAGAFNLKTRVAEAIKSRRAG